MGRHNRRPIFLLDMQLPVAPLTASLNHLLAGSAWARDRLRAHNGACLVIQLDGLEFRFLIDAQGYFAPDTKDQAPDVTISVPLASLPKLALNDQKQAMGAVRLSGNAELADTVAFVLRHIEWDVEADLSDLIGDIAAHRLVTGLRQLAPMPARTAHTLAENLREYFVEEQALLLGKAAIVPDDIELRALRDDIARLEKRIDRLTVLKPDRSCI